MVYDTISIKGNPQNSIGNYRPLCCTRAALYRETAPKSLNPFDQTADRRLPNIAAYIITKTIFGVPHYNYSIILGSKPYSNY